MSINQSQEKDVSTQHMKLQKQKPISQTTSIIKVKENTNTTSQLALSTEEVSHYHIYNCRCQKTVLTKGGTSKVPARESSDL